MLLAGDIGGTKTILAVYSPDTGPRKPIFENSYPSTKFGSLEAILNVFLADHSMSVDGACFGVAGPVVEGKARITNLPWLIDKVTIKTAFALAKVTLLNDLESVAYAIPILADEDIVTLNSGQPACGGNIAVLAPGTGLGEAFLTHDGSSFRAHASEGSHASFAPVNKLQAGLLQYLWEDQGFEHVSFERVCSGGLGVQNIYAFLKSRGLAPEPAWLTEKLDGCKDPTPVIIGAAQDKDNPCELCIQTLNMFVAILGAEAGNLALKVLSTGGIYLGGGIPPRILSSLQQPLFLESLVSKGRFKELLANMPVHVITNAKAGLMGAASFGLNQEIPEKPSMVCTDIVI